MPYVFCIISNLAALAAMSWLGYIIWNGGDILLIFIMALCSIHFIVPASDIYICPKCGHIDKVKVYSSYKLKLPQGKEGE